jgi:hypothetical protein
MAKKCMTIVKRVENIRPVFVIAATLWPSAWLYSSLRPVPDLLP